MSDYGFACGGKCAGIELAACQDRNWLISSDSWYWTLTGRSDMSNALFCVETIGAAYDFGYAFANNDYGKVRPSLYLKSNITFIGNGTGTEESPYILGINE